MLTPFHELVLVHATQQPVLTPRWVCIEELPEESYNQGNTPACTVQTPAANLARHRKPGDTASTIDGTLAIHRPSTEELDIQAEWREPIDDPQKPMISENLEEWLYVKGSAAPFDVKISYFPLPGQGPVIGRGIPGEDKETEQDLDVEIEEDFEVPRDAQELPVLPEVQSRGIPDESDEDQDDSDPNSDDVQERGVPKMGRSHQKGPKRKGPVRAGVATPQSQGPPPYDERPYRCAPAPPPPPPANYGQRFRFQGLHRFGDTKYRCVEYTAIGTSRYREYFFPMPDEENSLLHQGKLPPRWTRTSPSIMLDILSSALNPRNRRFYTSFQPLDGKAIKKDIVALGEAFGSI